MTGTENPRSRSAIMFGSLHPQFQPLFGPDCDITLRPFLHLCTSFSSPLTKTHISPRQADHFINRNHGHGTQPSDVRMLSCSSHDSDANRLRSTNLVIILGMMQVSKKIPFEDPTVLMIVRLLYFASNVIIAGIYFFCWRKINQKKGSRALTTTSLIHTDRPPQI